MPFVPAVIGGIGSIIGGAAAGAAGLIGGAASAVGSVASGILGGTAGVAGGIVSVIGSGISALRGGQAAVPVTPGMEMGQLSAASQFVESGVPLATTGISTDFSRIMSGVKSGVGIYGQLAQVEMAKELTETEKIKRQTELMEAEAMKIYKEKQIARPEKAAPLPTLATQPIYITPTVTPAAPNYLLYIGLAVLALFLFTKTR